MTDLGTFITDSNGMRLTQTVSVITVGYKLLPVRYFPYEVGRLM